MKRFPKRAALAAALASIGALAVPSAASATVAPPVVLGNTLTVTSDADGDTITLAAANNVITVNGAATTLQANGNAEITVNAGEGEDTRRRHGAGGELVRRTEPERRRGR